LDAAAASKVAADLSQKGYEAWPCLADMAHEARMQEMVKQMIETYGRIDILVNNAAMVITVPISRLPFDEIDPDRWDQVMRVSLKGMWLATRAVIPQMRKQKYGKIIDIGLGAALIGRAERIHYVVSKAGVIGFTRSLARAVGKDGIIVNCIAPGECSRNERDSKGRETRMHSGCDCTLYLS
jgi:3-oxoacyl-[acyl-carrier protein] reductase